MHGESTVSQISFAIADLLIKIVKMRRDDIRIGILKKMKALDFNSLEFFKLNIRLHVVHDE
jgi:hypothetical protein